MFSVLNILHIPNAIHEQCLDEWWHTPWTLTLVCYTVSPGFGVNSNIMSGLQHRNYIYKGTHGHPLCKLYESIKHLYISSHMWMWPFRHQNCAKIWFLWAYITNILSFCRIRCTSVIAHHCESLYANKTQSWLLRCYNKWLILKLVSYFPYKYTTYEFLPHAVHIHWRMLV